jgi:hypothetical protein
MSSGLGGGGGGGGGGEGGGGGIHPNFQITSRKGNHSSLSRKKHTVSPLISVLNI